MSGFIFLLLHFPHIQEKIQAEIDNAVGQARHPELTDRENMPFVRACILECLRYQSHLPLTAAHYNTEKVDIFGYTIPPKTIVSTCLTKHWVVNRVTEITHIDQATLVLFSFFKWVGCVHLSVFEEKVHHSVILYVIYCYLHSKWYIFKI